LKIIQFFKNLEFNGFVEFKFFYNLQISKPYNSIFQNHTNSSFKTIQKFLRQNHTIPNFKTIQKFSIENRTISKSYKSF
jgi:DNA-binding MurR/RpiR family transcriptional regulator